ncbi:hypothetical protein F7018_15750 [Tenacibaculum aiptasiae]|uniref:Uncharacterized protein n=1 Tax=Tenacibaculum aiptasiae TaxID=426481 RepID=A0A7J5A9V7_9FLAO|nr:hypothetical protein [Tenacibaculum aiptasiae]KAB1153939.1 hypothetical protein F7018_15750 [Tenacibaculum aiptasiae]
MNIELFRELDLDNPQSEIITVDIDENSSIGELLTEVHNITKIPTYTELEWDGKVEKIACRYYFKFDSDFGGFSYVEDLEQKISDFPKKGSNNELCILIDGKVGLAN